MTETNFPSKKKNKNYLSETFRRFIGHPFFQSLDSTEKAPVIFD